MTTVQCRICFSPRPPTRSRKHEFECCEDCVKWVESQPPYFPDGTVRSILGLQVVQWWDLQDLLSCGGWQSRVGEVPLTVEKVRAGVRDKVVGILLPEARAAIGWDQALAVRVTARGFCVMSGVPYQGVVENEVETLLAGYDIRGRR